MLGVTMSTSNQRRRNRRKAQRGDPLPIELQAEHEGNAIDRKFAIGVVHTPRMKRTYQVDGYTFILGHKHRCGGGMRHEDYMGIRQVAKPVIHRNSKQRNLKSENVHRRVSNPLLYNKLDIRRKIHLIEYQTGRVKHESNTK